MLNNTKKFGQSFLFVLSESRIIFKVALPIYIATLISEVVNSFIPAILAGHFGDVKTNYAVLTLSINFIFLTGTVTHLCLSSALNTLASQAYGAGNNKYLGTLYQRSFGIHLLMCLPIAVLWLNTTNIFTLMGQTAELSTLSGEYMTVYICILPAYAMLYPTMKILQIQEIVLPSTVIFAIGSVIEAITCYLLISQTNMGVRGIACGVVISVYFMAIAHLVYLRTMVVWWRIWDGFNWEALERWTQYLYYGMPLLITTWIEFSVYYYGTYLIGAISKNAAFVISTYSIAVNIDVFLFIFSFSLQSATSIRIGILVGEGNINKIKKVALLTTVIVIIFEVFQSSILLAGRSVWGYIFTSEKNVVDAVINILYALTAYRPLDGTVVNFKGVLLGLGMQRYIIIFSVIFITSIPFGTMLTIYTSLGPLGYWIGNVIAMIIRALSLIPIAFCWIDWDNIVPVDNTEQLTIEIGEEYLDDNDSHPQTQRTTNELQGNTILSRLKYKLLFFFMFIILIVAIISCKVSESTVDIHIGDSYLKSAINICCVRLLPSLKSHNMTNTTNW